MRGSATCRVRAPSLSSSDVYSFAITAWEIYHKTEAFSEFTNFGTFKRAVCTRDVRPPLKAETPKRFKELLEDWWHREAAKRPHFKEIIQRLDQIMVDVAVKDDAGNAFWVKHLKATTRLFFCVVRGVQLPVLSSMMYPYALTLLFGAASAVRLDEDDASTVDIEDALRSSSTRR